MPVRRRVRFVLFGMLILLMGESAYGADGGRSQIYQDAIAFYEQYGSSQMVFHEGSIFYGSRGSVGDTHGTRYGVCGQRFTLQEEGGKQYQCGVALEGSRPGSCKRISYLMKDGYRYSLYCIPYDVLFKRFQLKYPGVDFSQLMYNQHLTITADFYLCLDLNGDSQGRILETGQGELQIDGKVYHSYEGISRAAAWSDATMEALKHYFQIKMDIFWPSSYEIVFHKNRADAEGSMENQIIQYGERTALQLCGFKLDQQVRLHIGSPFYLYPEVCPEAGIVTEQEKQSVIVHAGFHGWSLKKDGNLSYRNQERIENLTKKHMEKIDLYALWNPADYTLPSLDQTSLLSKKGTDKGKVWRQVIFLGWSYEKMDILPSGSRAEDIDECLLPGTRIRTDRSIDLYGVWAYKPVQLRWEPCTESKTRRITFCYGRDAVKAIRNIIARNGKKEARILHEIIMGGYA